MTLNVINPMWLEEADLARFYAKIFMAKNGCWLWLASKDIHGYGAFGLLTPAGYKTVKAHRVSYALRYGTINSGQMVCHKCDCPKCVNPAHLFLGTQKDNMRDCADKGRIKIPHYKALLNGNGKLSEAQVAEIRRLKGQLTQRQLAKQYNVSQVHIGRIHRKEVRNG